VSTDALRSRGDFASLEVVSRDNKPLAELGHMLGPVPPRYPIFILDFAHQDYRHDAHLSIEHRVIGCAGPAGADDYCLLRASYFRVRDTLVPFEFRERVGLLQFNESDRTTVEHNPHISRWGITGVRKRKIERYSLFRDPRTIEDNYVATALGGNGPIDNLYNCPVEVDKGSITDEKNIEGYARVCGHKDQRPKGYPTLGFAEIIGLWIAGGCSSTTACLIGVGAVSP
jgi:hypothetical protein